jgi:purine-binding chemotaxis protein CheW
MGLSGEGFCDIWTHILFGENIMKDLLLVRFDGHDYGMWEEEVQAIDSLPALHHLPASPAYVAGVALIQDRAVTLADLAVCIGHSPMKHGTAGQALIMSDTEKFAGFAVSGELRRAAISSSSMHSMPDYLKNSVADSCVIINERPVPVLNVSAIYNSMRERGHEPPKARLAASGPLRNVMDTENVRLFELDGHWFAASAEGLEGPVVKPGSVADLPWVPLWVSGLAFLQGRVVPVIDLAQRLVLEGTGIRDRALVAELGGAWFGLLVLADEGPLVRDEFTIKRLPPIAESSWFLGSVMRRGEIIPLLELAEVISGEESSPEKPLAERYAPDSRFRDLFGKEETSVVEFSLLGQRHALPKSEVHDVIGFKPYREIPNAPIIVIGVAEHNDELLPVLDLAMVFGRRSLVTPDWRMMLVVNGDFRALVITEAVSGERRLPREIQRPVPILLPYHVVYGCYPDAEAVRLILNVEAISVHFEKALVQELLPALSPEMRQAPSEIVPSLLGEYAVPSSSGKEQGPLGERRVQEPAATLQPGVPGEKAPAEKIPEERIEDAAITEAPSPGEFTEVQKSEEVIEPAAMPQEPIVTPSSEGPVQESEAQAVSGLMPVPEPGQQVEASLEQREQPAQELPEEAKQPEELLPAVTEVSEEALPLEEASELPAPVVQEITPEERTIEEPKTSFEEHAREGLPAESTEAHEEPSAPEPVTPLLPEVIETAALTTPEAGPASVSEHTEGKTAEAASAAEPVTVTPAATEKTPYPSEEKRPDRGLKEVRPLAVPMQPEQREAPPYERRWLRGLGYSALGAALVLLLYLTGTFEQAGSDKKGTPKPVEKPAKETAQSAQERPEARPAPQKPGAPLVLEVPSNVTVEGGAYVVKRGDTLWSISKRLTGTPFNYPRIAGENKIANPDLIYPKQKISIKKKEK